MRGVPSSVDLLSANSNHFTCLHSISEIELLGHMLHVKLGLYPLRCEERSFNTDDLQFIQINERVLIEKVLLAIRKSDFAVDEIKFTLVIGSKEPLECYVRFDRLEEKQLKFEVVSLAWWHSMPTPHNLPFTSE